MKIGVTKRPGRVDIPQFSLHAVFEALVNAVAHRDYSIHASKIRLLARCALPHIDVASDRQYLMDRGGEGVPIILSESERLSGRRPEYRLIDDTEVLLTIFAASPEQSVTVPET